MTANEDLFDEPAAFASPLDVGGLIVGKYRVERLLGMGGMGLVVAARHLDLDRPVAIKVVREELAGEERILQRFIFEARSAAKIISEHVCKVIDVGRLDNGLPFIVMEMLEGRDLGRVLEEQGRIDPVECVDWILQVCEGVAHAHAAGIVHRDLKPENLLLTLVDGAPCVKILDFGISKQIGIDRSFTEPNGIVGSPRYMAPEQLLGGTVDERSDLWALGAIAYELMTGVPAFSGDTVASVCAKVIGDPPQSPRQIAPNIPVGLDEVILRCMRRERTARFRDAASVAVALAPFASERGRRSCQRIASMPNSRRIELGERSTVPLAIEPSNEAPESAPPRLPTRARTAPALALLVALVGAAYGGLRWLAPRAPSDAKAGSRAVASASTSPGQLAPVPGAIEPSAASSPADSPASGVSGATALGLPSAPGESPKGSRPSKADHAPTVDPRAPRPLATLTHGPASGSPRPESEPPSAPRATLSASPAPASSNPASDATAHASGSRSKLQEAWDIGNFGGRE